LRWITRVGSWPLFDVAPAYCAEKTLPLMMQLMLVARMATLKKTKFNQLPDQTTVKSTTSVGTPHFRSDAFQVATRRVA